MKKFILLAAFLGVVVTLGACTTREMATGAAAAGAGYIVGKEVEKDD